MRILRSYILRQHLVPLLLGFGVITFILEMDVLFDYMDLMFNRGVPPAVVGQLFLLSLGYIIALSIPCAVLVAVLMTFGRLSQDNEITALKAGGIHLGSILSGPIVASVLVALGLVVFNNYVLPETNHAFASLLVDIGRMRPTAKLEEGVFVTDFPGYNLLVQRVNGRTNEMHGVTLYQFNSGGPPTTILARRGFLTYTPDGRTAVLELEDGEIHEIPRDEEGSRKYRRFLFQRHIIRIAGAGGILERTLRESRGDREMSAAMLLQERAKMQDQYTFQYRARLDRFERLGLTSEQFARLSTRPGGPLHLLAAPLALFKRPADPYAEFGERAPEVRGEIELWRLEALTLERRIAGLSVEVHKKFSLPAACVVFVLVGAPLGMRVRRAGPAVAFVSVGFFLFYYLCLVGGEELANRLLLPPWLAMWLANIVIGVWGIEWTLRACEMPSLFRRRRTIPASA